MSSLTPNERVLQLANPAIYEKVEQLEQSYPQLNGRALRAGYLAASGAVQPAPGFPECVYHVSSAKGANGNDGLGYYIVELDANGRLKQGTCTCPDYFKGVRGLKYGAPKIQGNPKCKHIIALAILRAIEKDKKEASVKVSAPTEAQDELVLV